MPTTLNSGLQLPDKGSVDWYSSMQNNYNLLDDHLENTNIHVTAEDKANWDSKQGSLSQAQLDAIAQVSTNTSDITALQSGKANASHTHSSSDITDIGDYATKSYVDTSINGLVDNAPAALDTLKELSTALNDDANFASTVATALGAKANSSDLATVATSGSYNDLSNKPTINDSTITIQKNGSTVDTFTTNGSAKTINIPVPTKTSDLTNDSNFVDTSNSAVASGITSAKVTDYDTHLANTDIHVTTADKQKWNDNVNQSYVLRYASTSVTPSSTISYSVLYNTDNIKAGDSVMDSSGQVFLIASVDSANQTVTVSAVLLTLALDANVMHLSGNETVGGFKTFDRYIQCNGGFIGTEFSNNARTEFILRSNRDTSGQSGVCISKFRQNRAQGEMSGTDAVQVTFDVLENSVRTNRLWFLNWVNWENDIPKTVEVRSFCEKVDYKLTHINALNPGSLSLPDLDNGIDISGYIDVNTTSEYTALSNGYISICGTASATNAIAIKDKNFDYAVTGRALTISSVATTYVLIPVLANHTYQIICNAVTSIVWAKFFPNLGNV